LHNHNKALTYNPTRANGERRELDDDFHYTNVHIRGGYIIPYKPDVYPEKPLTVHDLYHQTPTALIIAPDHTKSAYGYAYFDDGETTSKNAYRKYSF